MRKMLIHAVQLISPSEKKTNVTFHCIHQTDEQSEKEIVF